MKAAVIHEFGGPEVFSYEDVPEPQPAAGEVVVERGVEVSAGGVRNKLGDGGGARGWIREAFAEGIVVGVERGAGEKEEEQVFSHGWDI